MAFIDDDEFILPKNNKSIFEVTDEILKNKPNAGDLCIHWHCFGSNGHEKADYTRGVLDRFTRRAPDNSILNRQFKVIADPRKINYWTYPHNPSYYEGNSSVDENGALPVGTQKIVPAEKIILNHYCVKSKEEFVERKMKSNSNPDVYSSSRQWDYWKSHDINDVFDDEILKYRDTRINALNRDGGGGNLS